MIWIIVKILTKFSFFIYKALQTFDAEKTHTITQSEFKRALDSFCVPLTEDQFEQLIKKVQIPCPSDRCIQNVGTLSQAVLPCSQEYSVSLQVWSCYIDQSCRLSDASNILILTYWQTNCLLSSLSFPNLAVVKKSFMCQVPCFLISLSALVGKHIKQPLCCFLTCLVLPL